MVIKAGDLLAFQAQQLQPDIAQQAQGEVFFAGLGVSDHHGTQTQGSIARLLSARFWGLHGARKGRKSSPFGAIRACFGRSKSFRNKHVMLPNPDAVSSLGKGPLPDGHSDTTYERDTAVSARRGTVTAPFSGRNEDQGQLIAPRILPRGMGHSQ